MTRRTTLFYCYLFLIYTFCVHLPSLNVEVFYMHLYNKEQAIKRMNQLGQLHRPFIFIINYLQDVSYIEEVAAVDSAEVLYNLIGKSIQIIQKFSRINSSNLFYIRCILQIINNKNKRTMVLSKLIHPFDGLFLII